MQEKIGNDYTIEQILVYLDKPNAYDAGMTYFQSSSNFLSMCFFYVLHRELETVQDFLIKLDIKPLMHLLKISVFSLNDVIIRLTKIRNRADKNWAHFY